MSLPLVALLSQDRRCQTPTNVSLATKEKCTRRGVLKGFRESRLRGPSEPVPPSQITKPEHGMPDGRRTPLPIFDSFNFAKTRLHRVVEEFTACARGKENVRSDSGGRWVG